jgi:hypothetical protein
MGLGGGIGLTGVCGANCGVRGGVLSGGGGMASSLFAMALLLELLRA